MNNDLKATRKQTGISQADLAKELGVSQGLISLLEAGALTNPEIYQAALDLLERMLRTKSERSPLEASPTLYKKLVKTKIARNLNWAWASFSRTSVSSDVFESVDLGQGQHAAIIADVVGSSSRGALSAAQLRFGFIALANATNPTNNFPFQYLPPLAAALKSTLQRRTAPPGMGIICLDEKRSLMSCCLTGLPAAFFYKKAQAGGLQKVEPESADSIWSDQRIPKSELIYLEKGDSFLFYTDGFWQWVKESKNLSTADVHRLFEEALANFAGDSKGIIYSILRANGGKQSFEPKDDATVLVVCNNRKRKRGNV